MKYIQSFTLNELYHWLDSKGIKPFRGRQIFTWVYKHQEDLFDRMTDLSKEIRALLTKEMRVYRLHLEHEQRSKDGSRKMLYRLEDGHSIESVLIPERDHYTLCISSQVGCAQGCRFCLTGASGFERNLTDTEIIAQVRDVIHLLNKENQNQDSQETKKLSNIVLMGMGEPLANYHQVVRALAIITDSDYGLGFSHRKVTLSTAGLVKQMQTLPNDSRVQIAVSLNATTNQTRDWLMPINKKYSIEKLLDTCKRYPCGSGKIITFEYVLLRDINDSIEDAKRLVNLLKPIRSKINLIPFNANPKMTFLPPTEKDCLNFQTFLINNNFTTFIRKSKGQDISAACGQLRAQKG